MPTLANLKNGLQDSIYTIEVLLEALTTFMTTTLEIEHTGYIQRINDLTFEANTKLLDIETKHRKDIKDAELTALRASLTNIKRKKSKAYTALRAWKGY